MTSKPTGVVTGEDETVADLVIDASVALKWVFDEKDSPVARDLLIGKSLVAPDFLWLECANVVWTRSRRKLISADDARAAVAALLGAPVESVTAKDFVETAHAIAADLDQTVYDSLYLAVAMARNAVMVTADQAFFSAAAGHGLYRDRVTRLAAA